MRDDDTTATTRRALLRFAALAPVAACDLSYHRPDAGIDAGSPAGEPDGGDEGGGEGEVDPAEDVPSLNALLAVEYGLSAAYGALAPLLANPGADDPLAALGPALGALAARFRDHHEAHARALAAAVVAVGGAPASREGVSFTPPEGFEPSASNALRAACNAEKSAAIEHAHHVAQLVTPPHRFLAGAIGGDETQHFVVLYAMLQGSVRPGPAFASMLAQIVPVPFAATVAGNDGLAAVPDLPFT